MTPLESKHVILAALYLVPFAVAVAMPEWRLLLGFALVATILAVWLLVFRKGPGGLGASIERLLVWLGVAGAASGVLTRGATLTLDAAGAGFPLLVFVTILGAAALPAAYFIVLAAKRRF